METSNSVTIVYENGEGQVDENKEFSLATTFYKEGRTFPLGLENTGQRGIETGASPCRQKKNDWKQKKKSE